MTDDEVTGIIVKTLRTAAEWFGDDETGPVRQTLRDVAADVEAQGPDFGTCPVCQEMICDDDCPYAATRAKYT